MPEALWKKVKDELSGVLPAHTINTWFEPIKPVTISNNELVLEVPNRFFYEWIESHYIKTLKQIITKVHNNDIKTRFIISAEKIEINKTNTPTSNRTRNYSQPRLLLNKNYIFESSEL